MRRAGLSLFPGLLVGIVGVLAWITEKWSFLGVPMGDRNYGDLNVIMAAADCAGRDPAWSSSSAPCREGAGYYNYPSLWAKTFGFLGADPGWTKYFAAFLILAFCLSLIPLTWIAIGSSASFGRTALIAAAAVMPPTWLAFQRGNIDQFVFATLVLGLCLWLWRLQRTAGIVLAVAATLKLFPIGSVILLFQRDRIRRGPLLAYLATLAIGGYLIARDLPVILARTPQVDGASFGVGLLPLLAANRSGLEVSSTVTKVAGVGVFVIVAAALAFVFLREADRPAIRQWAEVVRGLRDDPTAGAAFLVGVGAFLVAYLLGPSFDYRLIFLLPVIAGLTRIGSRTCIALSGVLVLLLALSYSTYIGSLEYAGDILWLVIAPALAVTSWQVIRRRTT